jgi:hypothetical protein
MLSFRSLAAELVSDPALLFNNAELSRVHWQRGPNATDIIVNADDDDDIQSLGVLDIRRQSPFEFDVEWKGDNNSLVDSLFGKVSPF